MSTHELLGHEIDIDMEDDEIVTALVVVYQTQTLDGMERVRFNHPHTTSGVLADGLIFNAYHAASGNMAVNDDWDGE